MPYLLADTTDNSPANQQKEIWNIEEVAFIPEGIVDIEDIDNPYVISTAVLDPVGVFLVGKNSRLYSLTTYIHSGHV